MFRSTHQKWRETSQGRTSNWSRLSRILEGFTFQSGDVVALGSAKNLILIESGDTVEMTNEEIGMLWNTVD